MRIIINTFVFGFNDGFNTLITFKFLYFFIHVLFPVILSYNGEKILKELNKMHYVATYVTSYNVPFILMVDTSSSKLKKSLSIGGRFVKKKSAADLYYICSTT